VSQDGAEAGGRNAADTRWLQDLAILQDGRGAPGAADAGGPGQCQEDLVRRLTIDFLTSGGDDRLILNPKTKTNKYNTPAYPEPRGIHRSSCTSNCVTDYTFHTVGEPLVRDLLKNATNEYSAEGRRRYRLEIASIREQIRNVWHLPKVGNSITLCPSGSDAEYLPLLLAISRCLSSSSVRNQDGSPAAPSKRKGIYGNGILNIVTGAGEVGSGTLNAAKGKFFSNVSPKEQVFGTSGGAVKSGENLFGLPQNFPPIEAMEVYMRNSAGCLKSKTEIDDEIKSIVRSALVDQNFKHVVVHVVTGSKTGHLVPSVTVLDELREEFGNQKLVPVIDACQGRLQEKALKTFLEKDYIVLTTGSKFYGGPPFSGAVLLPLSLSQELESYEEFWGGDSNLLMHFPLFMDDVLLSDDLPRLKAFIGRMTMSPSHENDEEEDDQCMQEEAGPLAASGSPTRTQAPSGPSKELLENARKMKMGRLNWGVVLRWKMALHEIKLYHAIPSETRDSILGAWVASTKGTLKGLGSPLLGCTEEEHREGPTNTDAEKLARLTETEAGMFLCNTIVSLVCRVPVPGGEEGQTRRLAQDDLKTLHKLMAEDLSGRIQGLDESSKTEGHKLPGPFGAHVVENVGDILSTKCFIAQPVQVQPGWGNKFALTVIRVTIGAPMVHWVFEKMKQLSMQDGDSIAKIIDLVARSDHILFRKMILVLEHWDEIVP